MDELKNAIQESLPENVTVESLPTDVNKDVKPESSEAAPVETPTTKVEQEVPFHQHPRFREIIEDRRLAQERADRLEQRLYELTNKISTPQQPDPDASLTPEERAFWARSRQVAREEAERVAKEKEATMSQQLNEQRMLVTSLMYERFQQKHPDIKSGSEEENTIAQKVRQGYSMEDAYTIVTSPKRIREAEETARKRYEEEIKVKNKTKVAANLEGPNIPSNSPVQGQRKTSVRDIVEAYLQGKLAA